MTLAKDKRYRFDPKIEYTASNDFEGVITFNKKKFDTLREETKCAVLAHELWHSILEESTKRGDRSIHKVTVGFVAVWILAIATTTGLEAGYFVRGHVLEYEIAGLALLIVVGVGSVLLYLVATRLRKRYRWPIELECDEAAVRFFGLRPTLDYLTTPGVISLDKAHPSREIRISNAEATARKYMVPMIDFLSLQAELPQKIAAP